MEVRKTTQFDNNLEEITNFIAHDSLNRALVFINDLEDFILNLPNMPFKFRKSIHFNDENIRDAIFKGYTITYFVNLEKEVILVLGIIKYKKGF
ncbi:MAG: type II toxin-antitoxin system RelE/ParE family toxin [Campylobacterales bacterium]|nr:type II toxin-antitoxin system RelE/ParE family toxin [Campylobacterales bacterium]